VVHAVSAFYERSGHMSPVAAALAAGLHVATALALFLVSPLNRHDVDDDTGKAIEVTIEQPKPPEPPPEPPKPQPQPPAVQPPAAQPAPPPPPPPAAAQKPQPQAQPRPKTASQERLGLPPKSDEPDKKQELKKGEVQPDLKSEAKAEPKAEPKPEPKAEAKLESKPEPKVEPKPEPTQEAAAQPAEPTPPPPTEKPLEKVLPPVEQPAAPLTMRDFVKVLPPPPPPPPSPPAPRPAPPPQQAQQQPQPSPLSQRPPLPQEQREASVSEFQNPAAAYSSARVHDDYLVSIARKMSQYRFVPKSMTGLSTQGVVVLSLVVSRDGRLLNSAIARTSGNPPMDAAVLETAQKAAPYGPLPPEIPGNSATFSLSVPYKFVAGQ
jgi:TonB family protein